MMKTLTYMIIGTLGILLTSCASATFIPTHSPNPWQDDYTASSAMEHYRSWGTYNVHDPSCRKLGKYYYMYSTDAIFRENREEAKKQGVPIGYIQVRRSKDLVKWKFLGWAFQSIPQEAVDWVRSFNNGNGATNIWAPYIIPYHDKYRLYYCVSTFGKKTSYIGLAESSSPEGPWTQRGCVVRTDDTSLMNAIDPSIIEDPVSGKWWMHYGSYFGGLYAVELDPKTGLTTTSDDRGHLVARRANYQQDNLEAPEIIYHPKLKQYYLFMSYDPLMTTYNVRAGRSSKAESLFTDYFGKELKDTTNNFPILTAPYHFQNHSGWAGTGHCGVFTSDNGQFFMVHQGRLSPYNQLMDLHLRQVFFTEQGWPVVSPERYTGSKPRTFSKADMVGEWEILRIREPLAERILENGQVLWNEGRLKEKETNTSQLIQMGKDGTLAQNEGKWTLSQKKQLLTLTLDGETIENLIVFTGHDWENEAETILFTGLDNRGRSIWGKRRK